MSAVMDRLDTVSGFVFADLFKDFKTPNADLFVFDNVSLALDVDSATSTLTGDMRLTGPMEPFKSLLDGSDTVPITAVIETNGGLGKKISPRAMTIQSAPDFHAVLFNGVVLDSMRVQVVMAKKQGAWIFTPSLKGNLIVNGLGGTDSAELAVEVSLDEGSLKLAAEGENIKGAFGLPQLTLAVVKVDGTIRKEQELTISTSVEVGATNYKFSGVITPEAVGVVAAAKSLSLEDLSNLFREISPGNLQLPEFDVKFRKSSIAFASADCTVGDHSLSRGLSLATSLSAHGYTISAEAEITLEGVAFSGSVGNIDVGPVTIEKAELDFQIYKKSAQKPTLFTIHGEAEIQHVVVDAGVYFERAANASSWVTLLYANVGTPKSESLRLSTFFPETQGSVMDQLSLSKMQFVFATADCDPQRLPSVSAVKTGLQLIAVVEEIPGLSDLVGEDHMDLELTAHLGDTVDIAVAMPDTALQLSDSVHTEPFKIEIYIAPRPSIALIFGLEVSIHNQPQPLHFDMKLDVSPIEATGSATMKNYWREPFGIHGLKIGPAVALQLGINYAQFTSTGTPATFGMAGGLAIGNTVMDMAVNISTNPMDEILSGTLKELELKEVVAFATDTVGLDIPKKDIPDFLDISELQFYIAPAGGMIGTIRYEKGISFACDMTFLGKVFEFYTRISENGIEGSGALDQIDIGPLKISGERGRDVTVGLSLTPEKQSFHLDGAILFLGVKSGAYVDVSVDGIDFQFEQDFLSHLSFNIEGKSTGTISRPEKLDFKLSADMDSDITDYLKNDVANRIHAAIEHASDDIDAAQSKVDQAEQDYKREYDKADAVLSKAQKDADTYLEKLHANVDKTKADYSKSVAIAQAALDSAKAAYDTAFNDAQQAVNKAESDYNSGIAIAKTALNKADREYTAGVTAAQEAVDKAERQYKNTIGSAQDAVNSAQRKVDSILGDIRRKEREMNGLGNFDPKKYALGVEIAALKGKYGIATAALKSANLFLEGLKKGGSFAAFESARQALHLAKTGVKYTAFESAKAALNAAQTGAKYVAFEGARTALDAVQHGSEYTAWKAAEQTLATARSSGASAIDAANQALSTVDRSAVYIALRAARQGMSAVKAGSAYVAFGAAKAALEATKLGAKAVLGLAEYIAQHSGDVFDVRHMHLSGSLKAIENGKLFNSELDVSVLGNQHQWKLDLDIRDVESFIDKLFKAAFDEAKSIAQS